MGWIQEFMEHLSPQESPRSYQFWCAVSAVGAALSRGAWMDRTFYTIYPNHFIVLLGPSGITRKSVPIDTATNILREADCIKITSDKLTPEYLMMELGKMCTTTEEEGVVIRSECFCYAEELIVFIGDREQAARLLPILTRLFNCPDVMETGTKGAGRDFLRNVCIHLLGGTTHQWLARCIPAAELGAGFAQRIIFVPERLPDHHALFWDDLKPVVMQKQKAKLVEGLAKIHEKEVGEYTLTQEAKDVAEKFYAARDLNVDDAQLGFVGRVHDHAFRLAMVLAASERNKGVVDVGHMTEAITRITDIGNKLYKVHQRYEVEDADLLRKVLEIVAKHGELSRSSLMQKTCRYANKARLDPIIGTLIEMGRMQVEFRERIRYYKAGEKDVELLRKEMEE